LNESIPRWNQARFGALQEANGPGFSHQMARNKTDEAFIEATWHRGEDMMELLPIDGFRR
jgi:hypothetical protein